jgi:hypothetical protein
VEIVAYADMYMALGGGEEKDARARMSDWVRIKDLKVNAMIGWMIFKQLSRGPGKGSSSGTWSCLSF